MEEYQERVIEEKKALDDNLSRLIPFIGSDLFTTLVAAEQKRLRRQEMLMELLSDVLAERIEEFV